MLEAIEQLHADAAKCAEASTWALPDREVIDALIAVDQLTHTLAAVTLHLIRQADTRDLATAHHHRGTAGWLRSLLRIDHATARRLVDQAAHIERRPAVDTALSQGTISAHHAAVITDALDALDALPTDALPTAALPTAGIATASGIGIGVGADTVSADVVTAAETTLLEMAGEFAPAPLRRLGSRILEHVAPEVAERLEETRLHREEARALAKRGLSLSAPFEGRVAIRGHLSVEDAAIVNAALDPLCKPQPGDDRTPAQMRADALLDICRLALRSTRLPDNGGEAPHLAVTIGYHPLRQAISGARLDTGDRITTSTARRIACDAHLLPIVLGGASQILDLGRTHRTTTTALRRALVARDRGCTFPGCDRPARWCDAHHLIEWFAGGPTSLSNLVLLCGHHHRLIHTSDWTVRMGTDDLPEFLPPATQDPTRQPRRNRYHPRT